MKANIINKSETIKKFIEIIDNMYRLGWDEKNGGNISVLMDEEEVKRVFGKAKTKRTIPLPLIANENIRGLVFVITGTTKYFRNVKNDPKTNIGVMRISQDGTKAEVIWGFENNGTFTSEIYAHLLCHSTRLKIDPNHHVVMHTHPLYILALTHVHELDEKSLTVDLWRTMTESVIVYPDGVGLIPWQVCGTQKIGEETAEKMKKTRCVIWPLHGIYGCENNLDDAFGLIETIEKSAQIFLLTHNHLEIINDITDQGIKDVAKRFNVTPVKGYLK